MVDNCYNHNEQFKEVAYKLLSIIGKDLFTMILIFIKDYSNTPFIMIYVQNWINTQPICTLTQTTPPCFTQREAPLY